VAIVVALTFLNPGCFLLDHVHFQYNGFLYGLFLASLAFICKGWFLSGAAVFAALLMLKHLFVYVAPAYFVYLLRVYCNANLHEDGHVRLNANTVAAAAASLAAGGRAFQPWQLSLRRFCLLGTLVVGIAVAGVAPFLLFGDGTPVEEMAQMVSRLFPIQRGLCHAYWAPNVWALYNTIDKGCEVGLKALARLLAVVGAAKESVR
jgi:alpha-1,3-glucosyltransferase